VGAARYGNEWIYVQLDDNTTAHLSKFKDGIRKLEVILGKA